ncbi:MAG: prepilin peptidase [Candidatus Brockarchaeota archaeon]|nr:prepilin peptidase [Candidatus Brockarchaeota archaeon]
MSYWPWLENARSIVSIILLSLGSIQDVKSREIDDRIWVVFLASAVILNLPGVFNGSVEPAWWLLFAGLQSGLFILLYYAGVYGGADAKGLMCLSLMYPSTPTGFLIDLSTGRLPVAFSTMNNALMLTVLYLPINLFWNISVKLRGVELFKGLEKENLLRRAAALLLLRKVRFSHYCAENSRFLLAERRSRSGVRRIVFSRKMDEKAEQGFKPDEHVFTSFLMPLQVLLLLGLVVRLFYGDILLALSLLVASRLAK